MSTSSVVEEPATPRTSFSDKTRPKKQAKIRAPNDLQRIFHTIRQKNSLYYISKAKSVQPEKLPTEEEMKARFQAYEYPDQLELCAYKSFSAALKKKLNKQEIRKKYCCKTNARTRLRSDILERLYVEDPDDIKGIKTLLDIDSEFFTIVEGRPIQRPFTMSKYLEDIRNVLRTSLMAGFRNDEMLLIDEKLKREKAAIVDIRNNYNTYVNSFEQCLNEDYKESMSLLRKADKAAFLTVEKTDLIQKLRTENAALEFKVHKLEERWRDLKMYQKFLYFVSPVSWRKKYDFIHRRELNEGVEAKSSVIFRKYNLTAAGQLPSLTNLVDEYLETAKYEEEPALYFTKTEQLLKVFRFIEIQNLNCLLHTEEIQIPLENMKATMHEARKKFENESKCLGKMIESLRDGIEWEENCAKELEKTAMKQVDTTFRNLIADDEILKLHVFVQDVYDSCVSKTDAELSLIDMVIAIEECYNNLVLLLDGLPQNIVKKAEKRRFIEEAKLQNICIDTAQKIALVESITWRLKKSLEPPYVKKRDLMWRSAPPEKIEKPPPPPRDLTAREKEYLNFFTVYCALTDNVADYGIDLSQQETDMRKFSVLKTEQSAGYKLSFNN